MNLVKVLPYYVRWHYSQGVSDMFRIWKNFLIFIYNFFSIHLLLFSLFSPWERMNEAYPRGMDVGAFFGTVVINVIMRCIGALVRSIVIVFGIISLALFLAFAAVISVIWITLPAFLFFALLAGLNNFLM